MTPERRDQLQEECEFLLSSLADLEREFAVGDVDADDYASLKDSYTARAATIIRELSDDSEPRVRKRIGWRPLAWSALILLLAITAGIVVARNTGERLPGQGMNGPIADGSVSSLLVQARSMGMSDIPTVLDLYSRVLAIEPDNVEALTYFGWFTVLSSTQEADASAGATRLQNGMVLLRQATITDSTYPDAHCFLGISFFRFIDDAAAAQPEMTACLDANPPAEVASMVQGLMTQINDAVAGTTTTVP
ncbi:MAG: hypothetical protein WCK23_08885 [Actinomycetes bacterium]